MKPLIFLTYSVIKKGIINNYFFILLMKIFFRLVKMTFGLGDVGYSLPVGQPVKLIFFVPCLSIASSRRSVSQGAEQKTARENI